MARLRFGPRRSPAVAVVLVLGLGFGLAGVPSVAAAAPARPSAADLGYEELEADAVSFVAAQRAARDRAARGSERRAGKATGLPAARIAVRAAWSALGARYVSSSSDPAVGLDCSGVTVFAWRRAGVTLPHSSQAQFGSFPRVPLSEVRPGDLVYYGDHGPHIAIYVGGGRIIHATSPAPGGHTRVDSMYGYDRPWGAVRVA